MHLDANAISWCILMQMQSLDAWCRLMRYCVLFITLSRRTRWGFSPGKKMFSHHQGKCPSPGYDLWVPQLNLRFSILSKVSPQSFPAASFVLWGTFSLKLIARGRALSMMIGIPKLGIPIIMESRAFVMEKKLFPVIVSWVLPQRCDIKQKIQNRRSFRGATLDF